MLACAIRYCLSQCPIADKKSSMSSRGSHTFLQMLASLYYKIGMWMMRWSVPITLRMNPFPTCLVQWHDQTNTFCVAISVECHRIGVAKDSNGLDAELHMYLNTPPSIRDYPFSFADWCNSSKRVEFRKQTLLQPARSKPHPNRNYGLTVRNPTRFSSVLLSSYRNIRIASWRSTR